MREKFFGFFFLALMMSATFAQGAYYIWYLSLLNIFFLSVLVLRNEEIKIDIIGYLLMGLLGVMVISYGVGVASRHDGMHELLKYSLYLVGYLYFYNTSTLKEKEKAFYSIFLVVMGAGLIGVVGLSPIANMVGENNGRLQSFFGYANTTALVMGLGAFYATAYVLKKRWLHLLACILFLTALYFTKSRIGMVTFAASYLLYLSHKVTWRMKLIVIGLIGVAGVVAISTSETAANMTIFSPTFVERYLTYIDATRLLLSNPLGIGVANWRYMQFYYQSAPYSVRYVHNFYLQVALDGGIVALGILLAIIGITALRLKKETQTIYKYIALFIAMNIFFEVHLNYGVLIIYAMYVLVNIVETRAITTIPLKKWYKPIIIFPIIGFGILFIADRHVETGIRYATANHMAQAYHHFYLADKVLPYKDSELYFLSANTIEDPQGRLAYLEPAYEINNWNTEVISELARTYAQIGDGKNAVYYGRLLLERHPFNGQNQSLVEQILLQYAPEEILWFHTTVAQANERINPLYRFISAEFSYK